MSLLQISNNTQKQDSVSLRKSIRSSSLQHPLMHLNPAHDAEILTCKFDKTGKYFASGSVDRKIKIHETFEDNKLVGELLGHKGPIIDLAWSQVTNEMYTVSSDKRIGVFDLETMKLTKFIKEHEGIINTIDSSKNNTNLIITGSNDNSSKIIDLRSLEVAYALNVGYPVISNCFGALDNLVFIGSVMDEIQCYDIRSTKVVYSLSGHNDSVMSIRLSTKGDRLLSYSLDNTVKVWDVKPFSHTPDRCQITFNNVFYPRDRQLCKMGWSQNDELITMGSQDNYSTLVFKIQDTDSGRLVYKLPGHKGTVTETCFHPFEPIVMSCSIDKSIFLGELDENA